MSENRTDKQDRAMGARTQAKTWGLSSGEYLLSLANKAVNVTTVDSKVYGGFLIGVDVFEIFIKTPAGAVLMLTKHSIKAVTAAPATNGAS